MVRVTLVSSFLCEYANNGSLVEFFKPRDAEKQQQTPWKFVLEAALGLEYLHERKIVHGDLRCSNILVGSDCASGEMCDLVRRMCCHDPAKRATLASVVYDLELVVAKEDAERASRQLEPGPACTVESFSGGTTVRVWANVVRLIDQSDNFTHCDEFAELAAVFKQLTASPQSRVMLERFHELAVDLEKAITTSGEQACILRLSSTCTPAKSVHAFYGRVELLWRMLGDSAIAANEREA